MIELGSNFLLDALPQSVRDDLMSHAERVPLRVGKVLFNAGDSTRYIHLLTAGMASIVTTMENGDAVEVGIVGREGLPESIHLLGPGHGLTMCFMQISGEALRIGARQFRAEMERSPVLSGLLLRFVQYQVAMVHQIAACNRLHTLEERLARWLLMVQDRVGGSTLLLTQEILGHMLGARRSTVTTTAGMLQRMKLIEYSRGRIRILDRKCLEEAACECYGVLQPLTGSLYR